MSRWRSVKQKMGSSTPTQKSTPVVIPLKIRFKVMMIDAFMISMPLFYGVIYGVMGGGSGFESHKIEGWSIIFLLHAIVIIGFWKIKGQTPGMKAYEIILYDKHKTLSSLFRLIIRFIVTCASFVFFVVLVIPFFRKDKKFLQDILSGTSFYPHRNHP